MASTRLAIASLPMLALAAGCGVGSDERSATPTPGVIAVGVVCDVTGPLTPTVWRTPLTLCRTRQSKYVPCPTATPAPLA